MTKQEMLDVINLKIARTHISDEGTCYFLPITKYDIISFNKYTSIIVTSPTIWNDEDYLHQQSDETISYVYSLL